MVKNNSITNTLYASSKIPEEKFKTLLWMFSARYPAETVSNTLGISKRSVSNIFNKLRERMGEDDFLEKATLVTDSIPPKEHCFWDDLYKCVNECPAMMEDRPTATTALPEKEVFDGSQVKWQTRIHMTTKMPNCSKCFITGTSFDERLSFVIDLREKISGFGGVPRNNIRNRFIQSLVTRHLESEPRIQLRVLGKIGGGSIATIVYYSFLMVLSSRPL